VPPIDFEGNLRFDSNPVGIASPAFVALLAVAFLYPILLCALAFPTPFGDLREQINWGLQFPLYTWKHPPLQSWIAGLIALSGARDAWSYMLVAQLLNLLGFCYVAATAQLLLGRSSAVAALIALCSGLYFIGCIPTEALNADQLLFPLWSGILYHLVRALRKDLWRDWIALGLLCGLSLLAKYFSLALIAVLAANLLWISAYRRVFRNPRFYTAGFLCAVLFLPTAVSILQHSNALQYSYGRFYLKPFELRWDEHLALCIVSPLIYATPFVIGLGLSVRQKTASFGMRLDDESRLVVITASALFAFVLLLVLFAGLDFSLRFLNALYGFGILSVLCTARLTPTAVRYCLRMALCGWAVCLVGTVVYASCFVNNPLREPAPAAAAIIQHSWNSQFRCGPAYIVGNDRSAQAVALYFKGIVTGVSIGDWLHAQWVDRDRLRRFGAVVIATPANLADADFYSMLQKQTPRESVELPYRHTLSTTRHVYVYSFVAPTDCGSHSGLDNARGKAVEIR